MTPDSGTAYMTAYDLFARKDIRLLSALCSDDPLNPAGQIPNPSYPGPGQPQYIVDEALLALDPNLNAALNSACGELESAVLRANFYAVSDLQNLNGNSKEYMKKILSNITMYNLYSRRAGPNPSEMTVNDYNAAMKALEDLSNGTKIFSFNETQAAGNPLTVPMQPWQYIANNLVTARWQRMWGLRQDLRRF